MKPEVGPKFVAFLEVGTELNLAGKKCTLRQNASKQGVRNTPEKNGTGSDGRTRAERREKQKDREVSSGKQRVRSIPEKKMTPVPMAVRGLNGAKNKNNNNIARCHQGADRCRNHQSNGTMHTCSEITLVGAR